MFGPSSRFCEGNLCTVVLLLDLRDCRSAFSQLGFADSWEFLTSFFFCIRRSRFGTRVCKRLGVVVCGSWGLSD